MSRNILEGKFYARVGSELSESFPRALRASLVASVVLRTPFLDRFLDCWWEVPVLAANLVHRYTTPEISHRVPVRDGREELQSYAKMSVGQRLTVHYFRSRPKLA